MRGLVKNIAAMGILFLIMAPSVAGAMMLNNAEIRNNGDVVQSRYLATGSPDPGGKLKDVGDRAGFSTTATAPTLPAIIGNVVNVFLSILGVVLTIIIIYAGYLWMTAQGNAEQVKNAKTMIIQAAIGLAITMAAYAITTFVVDNLMTSTGIMST